MSAFLPNVNIFGKNIIFTQSNSMSDVLEIFSSAFSFDKDNDVIICRHHVVVFFFDVVFPLSILITGPSFMSISSLVLELW